jgi:hypothetical protein
MGRSVAEYREVLMMYMLTRLIKKKLPWMLALGIAAAAPAHPLDHFTVSGECHVTGRGLLRVFLVDKWSFSVPLSGINTTTKTLHASGPRIRRVVQGHRGFRSASFQPLLDIEAGLNRKESA